MPYRFVDEIAIADVAFVAWGRNLPELFTAAADAVANTMVKELTSIQPRVQRRSTLDNDALDMLLFDFLQELIYLKDAEQLLLRARKVEVNERGRFRCAALLEGERLDPARHELLVDVKAVTLHRYSVERTASGWEARVILDV